MAHFIWGDTNVSDDTSLCKSFLDGLLASYHHSFFTIYQKQQIKCVLCASNSLIPTNFCLGYKTWSLTTIETIEALNLQNGAMWNLEHKNHHKIIIIIILMRCNNRLNLCFCTISNPEDCFKLSQHYSIGFGSCH